MLIEFRRALVVLIALVITVIPGCDIDIFGLQARTILGNYKLYKSEGDTYYLHHAQQDNSGYGVLEGTVGKIGWNKRYILVWQNPSSGTAGWMVVDSKAETITGPLEDAEVDDLDTVRGIVPVDPHEAWKKLR